MTDPRLSAALRAGIAGERELLSAFLDNYRAIFREEETARHAGQADIIREQIDGVTGPEI
jgi:hypothetical protein